jgi:hypothetical protein
MRRRSSAAVAAAVIGICGVLWQAVPASQQPGWQVTDLDVGDPPDLDIAVDTNGSAVAVWDKNQRVVGAAFSIASGTWAPAMMLSNPQDFSTRPRVEANAAGDAIAVWRGVRTSNGTPYVGLSRFSAATRTWSQVFELPANGYWPRAVIDANGNTTVVWAEWLREEMGYYYPYPVHEIRSARYEASTASWSPVVTLSGEGATDPQLVIDGAGNVTAVWGGERLESVRWSIAANRWSEVVRLVVPPAGPYAYSSQVQMAVDPRGDVVAVWSQAGEISGAMFSAGIAAWSAPVVVAPGNQSRSPSVGVDAAGNVTFVWVEINGTLRSKSFLRSTNSWTVDTNISNVSLLGGVANLVVDPFGDTTVVWLGGSGGAPLFVARRPPGGEWSTVTTFPESTASHQIASDVAGNLTLLLVSRQPPYTLQAARWTAPLARPSIAHVTSSSGALSIDFTAPRVLDPAYAVVNYEYSLDDGGTWTARTPASAASPIAVDGLIDGEEYPVRLRGVNTLGPGTPSEASILTPGLVAPANLRIASVTGNTVTFVWTPPPGVPPTGYMLEGMSCPDDCPIVRLPSPGNGTTFTAAAPNGTFIVRVRGTRGRSESQPSNAVLLNVGVAAPPSAPTTLLGLTDGGHLALAWQNTFTGGAPSDIFLDVSGDRSESFPLGGVNERFSFSGVPAGTYTFAVRAVNARGTSIASNAVTLTFPGTCSPPETPGSLSLSKLSDTISAFWSLPASGAAPTGYVLNVSGSINQSFNLTERTVSGTVPQGTYTISVSAANACGTSVPTPATTITIP